MGVFSLRLPEAQGGVGLGMAEAVLVFAELGRRVVPGPLLWSHLLAGLVPGAATGETIVGGLDRTHPSNGPLLVEYAGGLDALVVLAKDGVHRIDARKLAGAPGRHAARPAHAALARARAAEGRAHRRPRAGRAAPPRGHAAQRRRSASASPR